LDVFSSALRVSGDDMTISWYAGFAIC